MYKITLDGDIGHLFRKGWKKVASRDNIAIYMYKGEIAVVERISGTGTPRFNVSPKPEEPEEEPEEIEETEFIIPEESEEEE